MNERRIIEDQAEYAVRLASYKELYHGWLTGVECLQPGGDSYNLLCREFFALSHDQSEEVRHVEKCVDTELNLNRTQVERPF